MTLSARVHGSIADIGREAWDAQALPTGDPFLSYDFLDACEASGCAAPKQGWGPRHLALEHDGQVVGVMPLYLKGHSQGEYVFDHGWADAFERAGGQYYPKLLSAVPFTPASGPRLLVSSSVIPDDAQRRSGTQGTGPSLLGSGFSPRGEPRNDDLKIALLNAAVSLCEREGYSSLHINFPDDADQALMVDNGLLARADRQFVWMNRGYASFDDFLADLSSSHRKTIRRERRDASAGLDIRVLTGADLTEDAWDAFFAFYMDTGERKWGRPYLNRLFFSLIGERMADRIALVMAYDAGRPIAGALNFIGRDALYGRQWGALEPRPFLHFELCYYSAIQFAIENGLSRVEAGAQGEHKLARGYLPRTVHSAHWISHPGLRNAVADYLERERPAVAEDAALLSEHYSPFRQV